MSGRNTHIASNIRRLRLILGLSQVDFAGPLGINDQQLSKIERGRGHISADLVARIVAAYRIRPDRLYASEFLEPLQSSAEATVDGGPA